MRVRWAMTAAVLWTSGCFEKTPNPNSANNPSASPASATLNPLTTADRGGIRFKEFTHDAGIRFTYQNDEEQGQFAIIESMGGGLAIFDFDQDGLLDILMPGGGRYHAKQVGGLPSALYRNLGNWQFTDVTQPALIGRSEHYSHGLAVGDVNEDGFPDVLVTGYGGVMLYLNQGDGCFVDATADSGLTDKSWSTSAAWGDLNGDSVLDVYLAHYVNWSPENNPICAGPPGHPSDVCPPRRFDPLPDAVYFGNGDGTFRDATAEAGLREDGKGIGVVLADLDLDQDLDVYVANDTVPNFPKKPLDKTLIPSHSDGGLFSSSSSIWKVSLSSITPLNSKFSSMKSGRNNLSNDAVADGINIKLYKNAKLYFYPLLHNIWH